MSVKVYYEIHGFKELESALKDLRKEMGGKEGNITAKAMMKAAYPVWREAQARAPVSKADSGAFTSIRFNRGGGYKIMGPGKDQPGNLRKSIKRKRLPNPRYLSEIVGIGVEQGGTRANPTGAYYGKFVEFGTVNMPAQPFLRPALEANRAVFIQVFGNELGKGITREGAKIGKKYEGIVNTSANRRRHIGRA